MPPVAPATRDVMIEQLTSAMEVVSLPGDEQQQEQQQQQEQPLLYNPADQPTRPYDYLGPESDPIAFPKPRYYYGKRADVLCYNPDTDKHEIVKNVLFRDYSRASITASSNSTDSCVREAYWKIPYKANIKTIMGHVEICIVLERCLPQKDDSSLDESENDGDEDEEDIVFQWTKQKVAVKVNYCDRIERLKNRHAEDPLKEIAAMQLIGNEHPNVLGCKEVLFEGTNLNVVMRFCESGDLFQLLQDSRSQRSDTIEGESLGLSEGQARYWFRQIISGVQHLHSVGICHRDLSPENVMIDLDGTLIIDMGMCLRVPYCLPQNPGCGVMDIQTANSQAGPMAPRRCLFRPQGACGKLPYMSPEIYKNRLPFDGTVADVWTAGTILFCMVTGNRSYQRPHASDPQFYWMSRALPQLLADWNVVLSPEGQHLLQNMLQIDPRLRLTLDEVASHPWFLLPDEPMHR